MKPLFLIAAAMTFGLAASASANGLNSDPDNPSGAPGSSPITISLTKGH